MGLDMNIYSIPKKYITESNLNFWNNVNEIAYWRKFNSLHNWFESNLKTLKFLNSKKEIDEDTFQISKNDIEKIYNLSLKIINEAKSENFIKNENNSEMQNFNSHQLMLELPKNSKTRLMLENLFPTQNGPFFGSTNYNYLLLEKIENCLNIFKNILTNWNDEYIYFYSSSW